MQFGLALGTRSAGIESGSEDGAAIGTARACDGTDHAGCAGTELIGARGPPAGACGRVTCLSYLAFPRRGNRGVRTFDPQTPPSASLDGLPRLQLMLLRCRACQLGLYPIGLLHSAGRRTQTLEVACRMANVQRAGDGTSMFVALWEYEVSRVVKKDSRTPMVRMVRGCGCSGTTPAIKRRGW